ncbi:probable serine/threonine-protein kinase DDB_G0282963 isoform X2 [Harpegnathos saltator]|uniref:probable serine/threonine-protein kinase DDB_G0282963 isoform X2 n=1 Tax=Harpegnathos saltator TaxID=610380 RepID=UPI00058BE9B6|nr:probable serine/threonine-protein kinase DDB_G0282963 isoform X2 [Harpegnathos saltator]
MGSLIIILTAVAVCCTETCCDMPPATSIVKPADTVLFKINHVNKSPQRGPFLRDISQQIKMWEIGKEEIGDLRKIGNSRNWNVATNVTTTNSEPKNRKARLLGSLAFLAGLGFGGLATAASSTVKSFVKVPQTSVAFNLSPTKNSPYLAAYYNPFSFVPPYPFFYHSPFGLVPTSDLSTQTMSHLTPQVISIFSNKQTDNVAGSNEEYADAENLNNDKSMADSEDGVNYRTELHAVANRNAEEKMELDDCKDGQRKYSSSFKGSSKELEANTNGPTTSSGATEMTADANQTMTKNKNKTTITTPPPVEPDRMHHHYHHHHHHHPDPNNNTHTIHSYFPGYYDGYAQDISHVDLTTGSDVSHHYQDHGQINLPHERPANFYHDDVRSNHHVAPYFPGSFSSNQVNGYVNTDFDQASSSGYQSPNDNGFKPI